jgi:dolichol-phosphate mannosyltransferase
MEFSVVIPAHNEGGCIEATLRGLRGALEAESLDCEIVVVLDHCTDRTGEVLGNLAREMPGFRTVENPGQPGYGMAVRAGLEAYQGDAVAIVMADGSDDPGDVCRYFRRIEAGAECVFGSRFMRGSHLAEYPWHKLVLNRLGNWLIRGLFRHGLNDTTNAFKCYRRNVIDGCRPFLAVHFNLTVELPLKAVIRGYRYEILPIAWYGRKAGESKLRIKEMGSRYFFIILYCLLERLLTGGDYHRADGRES